MTDRRDWEGRTGRKWAEEWRRTDRAFAGLTDRLLGRASAGSITQALDVGCGAGELTLALARGRPHAQIVGIDISKALVDVARERGRNLANAEFKLADAAQWSRAGFSPDLVLSRHGVMFFDRPTSAFTHLGKIAAPGARLVFSCFRDRSENPWAFRVADLLPSGTSAPSQPGAPGPFAFADPSAVEAILLSGGWRDVSFESVDFALVVGTGEQAVGEAIEYFLAIGPAAAIVADLEGDERDAFIGRLTRFLESERSGAMVALPAAAWIVSAQRG